MLVFSFTAQDSADLYEIVARISDAGTGLGAVRLGPAQHRRIHVVIPLNLGFQGSFT